MAYRPFHMRTPAVVGIAAAIALDLCLNLPVPANAAPLMLSQPATTHSMLEQAQIFKRGRPPIYPYVYRRGRPGGWDFYFGPVPYQSGNIETQALQRRYPQLNYPPSMRYWNPQTPF